MFHCRVIDCLNLPKYSCLLIANQNLDSTDKRFWSNIIIKLRSSARFPRSSAAFAIVSAAFITRFPWEFSNSSSEGDISFRFFFAAFCPIGRSGVWKVLLFCPELPFASAVDKLGVIFCYSEKLRHDFSKSYASKIRKWILVEMKTRFIASSAPFVRFHLILDGLKADSGFQRIFDRFLKEHPSGFQGNWRSFRWYICHSFLLWRILKSAAGILSHLDQPHWSDPSRQFSTCEPKPTIYAAWTRAANWALEFGHYFHQPHPWSSNRDLHLPNSDRIYRKSQLWSAREASPSLFQSKLLYWLLYLKSPKPTSYIFGHRGRAISAVELATAIFDCHFHKLRRNSRRGGYALTAQKIATVRTL